MWEINPKWLCAVRGKWCLRLKESADTIVLSDYLKKVKLINSNSFIAKNSNFISGDILFFNFISTECPLGHSEWQRSLLPDFSSSSWAVDSKLASELCSQWQSCENKPSCRCNTDSWTHVLDASSHRVDIIAKIDTFVFLGGLDSQLNHPLL